MQAEPGSDEPERQAKDQVVKPRHCEGERGGGRGEQETACARARAPRRALHARRHAARALARRAQAE
jgi:hypothetical protein